MQSKVIADQTVELVVRKAREPVDIVKWSGYSIQAKTLSSNIQISNDHTAREAVDTLKILKNFSIELDHARREKIHPFHEMVLQINEMFKPISDGIDEAISVLKEKLLDWQHRKERLRLELESRQLEEFETSVQASAPDADQFPAMILPPDPTIHGNIGTVSRRRLWRWRIIDRSKVPQDLLTVDEKLISERVRAGVRRIPGIEIYQEEVLSIK